VPDDDEPEWGDMIFQAPEGLYDVIVIDEINYASEESLSRWTPLAADDCHVWIWAEVDKVPVALRLIEHWDFQYKGIFVWHKPDGSYSNFDKSLPLNFNCEFAIYAHKGNPQFTTAEKESIDLCFNATRGANFGKPHEFYDFVKRITAGRRAEFGGRYNMPDFHLIEDPAIFEYDDEMKKKAKQDKESQ
jgi:N6-adenosine-specific RNA methylase IME4